jgi:hypothetical protein
MKNVYFRTKVLSFIAILGIIMLSSPSIMTAQFFFKEYNPTVSPDNNGGNCIINIENNPDLPNPYLIVGYYSDASAQQSQGHALRLNGAGNLTDTMNYFRPETDQLVFNRIAKKIVNALVVRDSILVRDSITNKDTIIVKDTIIRGYPAVGTRTIVSGFPYQIVGTQTWVTILDHDNTTVLWEDFVTDNIHEYCSGVDIIIDHTQANTFYVLMQLQDSINGNKSFAVIRYFWNTATSSVTRGWKMIYTHTSANYYDAVVAGITQHDATNSNLVIAGTYIRRDNLIPAKIFTLEINNGGIITNSTNNLFAGKQYYSLGGSGFYYPLLGGVYAHSISNNEYDDGFTIAGKAVQNFTFSSTPTQYTLPMILHISNNLLYNNSKGYTYKVFRTYADDTSNNYMNGEFYYARKNTHWRIGSAAVDTSYTAVGYLQYSDNPGLSYAIMANSNMFTSANPGLNRWLTMHSTDFSQSYSTPVLSVARWYDADTQPYTGGFVYTGSQTQPSGSSAIAARVGKYNGFSECGEMPYRVDTAIVDTAYGSGSVEFNRVPWSPLTPNDTTDEWKPSMETRYCDNGYIGYMKTADFTQPLTGQSLHESPQVLHKDNNLMIKFELPQDSKVEMLVTDIMGRSIVHERFDINKGVHHYMYATENLLSGNYFLSIKLLNKHYTYPFSLIK